jgi:SAM-dependent methyltransferase
MEFHSKLKSNFWESFFSTERTKWKFEPSDSAIYAAELFKKHNFKNILIPGVGYGRNAKPFLSQNFSLTGIEISESAINLARENGFTFPIHMGSVTQMPFDNKKYDGIFCYALLHLFNKSERRKFLKECYNSLTSGGLMIFTVISKESDLFTSGKYVSHDRMLMSSGLKVYFYDKENARKEFKDYPIVEIQDIDEPIKFAEDFEPMKCIMIICRKRN